MPLTSCFAPFPPNSVSSFIFRHHHLAFLEKHSLTLRSLQQLHGHFIKTGIISSTIAASRVLASAATTDLLYAQSIFNRIRYKNLFIWNTIIRAYANSSIPEIGIKLFVEMLVAAEVEPTRLTYPSVLKAFAELGWDGRAVHGRVVKEGDGVAADGFVRNTLLRMYASLGFVGDARKAFDEMSEADLVGWNSMIIGLGRNGKVGEARRVFDGMKVRNVVTWNSMISGYVRGGEFAAALELFGKMQVERVHPCEFTMVSVLNACGNLGALEQGEWIHDYMRRNGMKVNAVVLTAIVDMYCKCGNVERALEVFDAAVDSGRGLSCWNTMILGLAMNGLEVEAIDLFARLECSSMRPDHVSFVAVLTACNHSGLVDRALKYFSNMTSTYNLQPNIEHYGCLVDTLGRAGRLREAEKVILNMSVEPDAIIWGSLLSACRKYGNIDMAERAAGRLMELDPKDSCGYVLMSNMYSYSNQFEEALEQRLVMKKLRVEKDPGCSLINANGEAHEFVSGGRLHTHSEQIYSMLKLIFLNMYDAKESHVVMNGDLI